ncbi:ABC transporter ATP-binding protein [Desulfovibrio gilichinskyi]|uniref:Peptide/nickel transport system ATP-binding protein/Fe3+-transporting ATPase n=1 Tax=Desulfovibrio gilichinskyi TaxID=1519643 RepID=A0A1X7F0V8_9BACT|nr:ATP-binding cassette domain-containing protein [Desulfovibrio gilichinskyi]SMF43157.1 peptide/nickel transport system ATP-binding protein/Fe3+-transporting ATPase [Desulfovibrio gilichinskyi]
MLKATNLTFKYEKNKPWLFEDFDLSIAPGEIVGLPGPSGRGKSTLAKILAGYLSSHEAGEVLIDGSPLRLNEFCPAQLIFQHPELAVNPRWKIKETLCEAGTPDKNLLEELSINNAWLERYPHELSGGELQRICLARALNPKVKYLLCDEMTSMLDALTQAAIWKVVLGVAKKRNLGLLVISHDGALISRLCDRTIPYFLS